LDEKKSYMFLCGGFFVGGWEDLSLWYDWLEDLASAHVHS
jgi:hypothetical protein